MASNKPLGVITGPTLGEAIKKYSGHPREYTTTLYNENGKLLDDGLDLDNEKKTYWEFFLEPRQARELERRLKEIEDDPSATFNPMED